MTPTYGALPPPRPRPKRRSPWFSALIGIGAFTAALLLVIGGVFGAFYFFAPAAARTFDNQFGDQHLKTSVALIELHKVRFGKYPDSLSDLKFTGQWDPIALQSIRYYPNAERTAYYVEVEKGWMGKPDLKMPDEFWQGTGYTTSLKPTNR
jgi:hypothetical protein